MLAYFSVHFTVVAVIAALAVSAASIPRPKGKGKEIYIPLTKHSPSLNSNKSINIDRLKSRGASHTAKLLRGLENYERNTGTTHPSTLKQSRSQNRKRGGAPLDLTADEYSYGVWWGTISIGTPPKPFTVLIDTGSGDLFIPASNGDQYCRSHDNLFNPASSESAKDLDKPFQLEFNDGASVRGKQYTDNVTIAGFTTIGVATTYSTNMEKSDAFPTDGILGLAFPSVAGYSSSPLLQTLVSEGKLPDEVFSLKLTSDGGELYIGGVNEGSYTGDITFVNARTQGYWEVIVDNIRVDGKLVLENVVSIIDSGANHIYGDPDRVLKLHQAHGGKAFEDVYYTFPCDEFPDVAFTFGGTQFTIPAHALNYGPVEDDSPDCFTGIVAHVGAESMPWSIGSNFLEHFYTVFNIGSNPPQVGFAQL